ncbi:hypothetical protein SAMN02745866_00115 [Alteromonadaceae bacterium Bs31]|nr:hypothetical protein SAMN02745866_00115 [Alteromonadaceae bacterium Bs31]
MAMHTVIVHHGLFISGYELIPIPADRFVKVFRTCGFPANPLELLGGIYRSRPEYSVSLPGYDQLARQTKKQAALTAAEAMPLSTMIDSPLSKSTALIKRSQAESNCHSACFSPCHPS